MIVLHYGHGVLREYTCYQLINGAKVGTKADDLYKSLGLSSALIYLVSGYNNVSRYDNVSNGPATPNGEEGLLYVKGFLWELYVFIDKDDRVSSVCIMGS